MENQIRQPIVTVCGHVDHGKTSILDCLRSSCVQEGEAGGITQKISFTSYPMNQLKAACPLIGKSGIKLNIPGFLLIDTPGHAAFINLRKRGGSLADLAVLVIDNISGWRNSDKDLKSAIESQQENVKQVFDERYMTLIGALNNYGFDADLYYNIDDFTKQVALVPCSAITKQGIPELIMMLCGLSQRYLTEKLKLHKDAKGVMLEIKKEKSTNYIEAILYDGELSRQDEIAVASFDGEPIITKIRILEEILPLCSKFIPKDKVQASTGVRMQLVEKENILPGMPFVLYKNNLDEIREIFKKEISENIKTEKYGIIAKADSLGSLEALLVLLGEKNISVVKAGIGSINKSDVISAKANLEINELNAIIIGFNVNLEDDAKEILQKNIKVLTNDVVYRLIDDLVEYRKEKMNEIEKRRLMSLATICKLRVLPQYVFRNTKPAIFGVRVEGGKLTSDLALINSSEEKVGRVKNIESEGKSVHEANENLEVSISIPGINFERQLKDVDFLYTDIGESQFRNFKKNKDLLSENEKKILMEIADIKRKKRVDWGT